MTVFKEDIIVLLSNNTGLFCGVEGGGWGGQLVLYKPAIPQIPMGTTRLRREQS